MITLLAPSKTQDFGSPVRSTRSSEACFLDEAARLADRIRTMPADELEFLMSISDVLARRTRERYQLWQRDPPEENTLQAIFAYTGEVYRGLSARTFSAEDLCYAQDHLRILSGLYAVLRPLDRIQPHRLEMATPLVIDGSRSLYDFWADKPGLALSDTLEGQGCEDVVNLASREYVRVIRADLLPGRVITPTFKNRGRTGYRTVAMHAKNARGRMAHWIVSNRIDSPDTLVEFQEDGYRFNGELSTIDTPVFVRDR